MPKWLKLIIGILLIPLCLGAVRTFWLVLGRSGHADTIWVATFAGVLCWIVIYLLLPRPMWWYVVGHELTHAIWTWLFLGRVKKFKATSTGGHVVVTKTNFLIALAPYFFPIYVGIIVLFFVVGHLIWGWHRYAVLFHLLIGAAYAFHVTLTLHVLKTRQSDITEHGYVFSFVVIFLGNIAVLIFGIPVLVSGVSLFTTLQWWGISTVEVWRRLISFF